MSKNEFPEKISTNYSSFARLWRKYYKLNYYYHRDLQKLAAQLIPRDASVIEFSCRGGELLSFLPNKIKVGIEYDESLLKLAKRQNLKIKFINGNGLFRKPGNKKFDYILLSHTSYDIPDVQALISDLKKISHDETRVIVSSFNFLWKPILDLGERLGLRLPMRKEPNWLSGGDIDNLFYLESYDRIKSGRNFLIPYNIPIFSMLINRYISQLPLINSLCLTNYALYRLIGVKKDCSVSIIIPARNEEGNMRGVLKKIPKLGTVTEVIFIEGHSRDKTYKAIKEEIRNYKGPLSVKLFKQKGRGKGDAVRLGFSMAKNDLLMILDADLTVDPKELSKFYNAAISGKGDLIIGSRLVYPMEEQAMRILNYLGNKFFNLAFTFLLGQKIKDTLCGTKVIFKKDYKKIETNRKMLGDFDPFGDFDLIFGAAKLNMKITEIPIRYKERTYGETNISRFKHGLLLLRMVMFAAKNLKFV